MTIAQLDEDYRLTPWSVLEHKAFVSARAGEMKDPTDYIEMYVKKEQEFDAAYENQVAYHNSFVGKDGQPSAPLEPMVKIAWNPLSPSPVTDAQLDTSGQ